MLHFKTVSILIIQKLTIALTWILAWLLVFGRESQYNFIIRIFVLILNNVCFPPALSTDK